MACVISLTFQTVIKEKKKGVFPYLYTISELFPQTNEEIDCYIHRQIYIYI